MDVRPLRLHFLRLLVLSQRFGGSLARSEHVALENMKQRGAWLALLHPVQGRFGSGRILGRGDRLSMFVVSQYCIGRSPRPDATWGVRGTVDAAVQLGDR